MAGRRAAVEQLVSGATRRAGAGRNGEANGSNCTPVIRRAARRPIDRALDHVLELAHVAGPGMRQERVQRLDAEAGKAGPAEIMRHGAAEVLGEQRDVLAPGAQRRHGQHVECQAIQEILAEAAGCRLEGRSTLVAPIRRTSTWTVALPPTRSKAPYSTTRRSRSCTARLVLAISSRNRLPPSASSKRPRRCRTAPVNAPASWPNSSLSRSVSGQRRAFSLISGRSQRGER